MLESEFNTIVLVVFSTFILSFILFKNKKIARIIRLLIIFGTLISLFLNVNCSKFVLKFIKYSNEIYDIGDIVVNNYVLKTRIGPIIIDTGYPGGLKKFLDGLARINVSSYDIKYIFITHSHDDHVGFLKDLLDVTRCPVIIHPVGNKRLLLGQNVMKGGFTTLLAKLFGEILKHTTESNHHFPPVELGDRALLFEGKQILRDAGLNADIIALPGHTEDSIGILFDNGDLFCGDASMSDFPSLGYHIIFCENPQNYQKSLDVIFRSKAKLLYPSHGRPIEVERLKKNIHFLDNKQMYPL